MVISLCVSFITHPASLLTANKWLCVCHGIRIILRYVSLSLFCPSFFHPTPLLTTITLWLLRPRSSSCLSAISPSLWCLPVVCILQASVGWRHSPQAAEHLPFFTQGGRGERLPPDSHQQSYHRQRGQSQGPRYSARFQTQESGSKWKLTPLLFLFIMCVIHVIKCLYYKSAHHKNPNIVCNLAALMFMKILHQISNSD